MLNNIAFYIGGLFCVLGGFVLLVILWYYAIKLSLCVFEYWCRMMAAHRRTEVVFRCRTEDGQVVEYSPSKKKIKQVEEDAK